ncbi:hypothetical protein [Fusobacterium animalis]|uniref:toxin-antitoxin system YwqK family antitoxin n=1 Tax=Fusobacterium animalis TaxID=76859 RepID=UPI0030D01DF9
MYYPTGNLELERLYYYGSPNGKLIKYHKNGAIKLRASFVNGLLYGTVGSYNENRELIMKVEFRNGEPLSEISDNIEEFYLEINEERKKN